MKKRMINNIAIVLLLFFLISCNKGVVYSKYYTFKESQWKAAEKAEFEVDITDTLSLNNINLMIRHADAYPYSNIFLFVTTAYPDGKVLRDTMEIVLANSKGEWIGSGAGDLFDYKVPVKKNVRFPLKGKYKFAFEQGMRVDPLPYVMDFGFEIEKSKE